MENRNFYKDLEYIKNEVSECSLDDVYSIYSGWTVFIIMYIFYRYSGYFSTDFTSATLHDFLIVTILGAAFGNIMNSTIKIATCKYIHHKKLNLAK